MRAGYRCGARKNWAKSAWGILLAGLVLLFLLLLQTTVLPQCAVYSAVPQVLLVFCICFSLIQGRSTALVFSVFAGFLQETLNGGATGYNALLYLALSWICIRFSDNLNGGSYLLSPWIVLLLTFAYASFRWGADFLLWNEHGFGKLLLRHIFPTALYSTLTAPIFVLLAKKLCALEMSGRDWA